MGARTPKGAAWRLSDANLEELLRESREVQGESLWRDAWRRLRRNRAASWSLHFLCCVGLVSLLAPLLPLPSPKSQILQQEPIAPRWPWEANWRLAGSPEVSQMELGTASTRALGGWCDDGWQHRALIEFNQLADQPILDGRLLSLVEAVSGRRAVLQTAPGEEPGALRARLAIPLRQDDKPRVDWVATGREGTARVLRVRAGGGDQRSRAWLEADVPLPLEEVAAWRVEPDGSQLHLVVVTRDARAGDPGLRYTLPLAQARATSISTLVLNGLELPPTGQAQTPMSAPARRSQLPAAAVVAGSQTAPDPELVERRSGSLREARGQMHDDLARRLARAMDEAEFTSQVEVELVGVSYVDGYWELASIDQWLVELRGRAFGLWQTGAILGTDSKGRDLLARIAWGSRISIQVSLLATLVSLLVGVSWGALAGFVGGRLDNLMMRVVDVLYSIPFIFVVIFLLTIVNEYRTELVDELGIEKMHVFYAVIGLVYWLTMARVVRGQVLSLKNMEFVDAARVLGASTTRILRSHLVPNVLSVVIVYLTLTIPAVMLFEAFLSFLGLGVEPPKVSWGLLAVDGREAITALRVYWWLVAWPAAAMGSTLLALNILGDGLRDALDPKLRGLD